MKEERGLVRPRKLLENGEGFKEEPILSCDHYRLTLNLHAFISLGTHKIRKRIPIVSVSFILEGFLKFGLTAKEDCSHVPLYQVAQN